MRIVLISTPATVSLLCASAAMAQAPTTPQDVRNLVPATVMVEQFVVTPDSVRTYYAPSAGGIWMYDRRTNTTSRITDDAAWDLALAPKGDALLYTKAGVTRRDQQVWFLPLSSTTGLPTANPLSVSSDS